MSATPAETGRRRPGGRATALILAVVSAAVLWGAGRLTWVTAVVEDDKSGGTVKDVVGAVYHPAVTPLALAILAAMILSWATGPRVRRVLGVVAAALAALAALPPVMLLTGGVDLERTRRLLSSGAATQKQSAPDQISDWAQVSSAEVHHLPVALAILAAAVGVVGGILLMMRPGTVSAGHSRYETPEARRQGVEEDLEANPRSGRVLWDALDAGVDPTDRDPDDGTATGTGTGTATGTDPEGDGPIAR